MARNSPPPVSIIAAGAHTIATGLPSAANRARRSDAAAAELSQMTRYSSPYAAECTPEFVKLLRHVVQDQHCWIGHRRSNCVDPPTLTMAWSALRVSWTATGWSRVDA